MSLLVGALVAAAVLVLGGAVGARRRGGHLARPGPSRRPLAWWVVIRRRGGRPPDPDLGVVVTEVATRLRAGAHVESAWRDTLLRHGVVTGGNGRAADAEDGVPGALAELARSVEEAERWWRRRSGAAEATMGALPGTVAACRLTHEIGAPLAQVLERCAHGLTEAGQARAARAIALAAPRASARLLGWLPLLGLVLGMAVGADPLEVLLGGGLGSLCLVAGLVLLVLGRRWVAALERSARAAGR